MDNKLLFVATVNVHNENYVSYTKELVNDVEVGKFEREILDSFKQEIKIGESRRATVRKLAERMESIKNKHGLQNDIGSICTEIVRSFRKAGVNENQLYNIYEAFEKDDYKKYRSEIVYSRNLGIPGNLPEENSILFTEVKKAQKLLLSTDFRKFTTNQIQEIDESSDKIAERWHGVCDENRIATVSTAPTSHEFYNMSRSADQYSQKIETQHPTQNWTELSDAWERISRLGHEIAVECANFPPQIKESAHELALAVHTLGDFIEAGTDKKHKRSPMDWIETLESSIDSTINGTATMHPTESNLCEKCNEPDILQDPQGVMKLSRPVVMKVTPVARNINEEKFMQEHKMVKGIDEDNHANIKKIQEIIKKGWCWECPKCHGVKGREIIISREHTSDMIKPTIKLVKDIVNHFPALVGFLKWYSDWRRPMLDAQTINLSPKLRMRKSG
jgi:rubrerythrin